jgi:hypothetical protein
MDPNMMNDDYGMQEMGDEQQEGEGDEDVDDYFDDAGDIGYLPADHVSYRLTAALDGQTPSCPHQATDG